MNTKKINVAVFIILFFLSFVNFNYNFLNVAGTNNFYNIPATNGEVESTDGILYGLESGHYLLGRYERNNFKDWQDVQKYKKLFEDRVYGESFKKYVTSFGLQAKIFGNLVEKFDLKLKNFHTINSLIFSSIIALFAIYLQKNFTLRQSIVFALAIATSPWVVAHAKDIRWITWSWYLPLFSLIAINYYFDLKKLKTILVWFVIVYLLILFRCLFGYEYLSTIMSITYFYFLFILLKLKFDFKKVFILSSLLGFISVFAFLTSFLFHNNIKVYENMSQIEGLKTRISVNMGFIDKKKMERNPCLMKSLIDENKIDDCNNKATAIKLINYYEDLDKISRLEVLGRYFIFRNLLPYFGSFEKFLDNDIKSYLKEIFWERKYYKLKNINEKVKIKSFFPIISVFFQTLFFIFIIIFTFRKIFKHGDIAEKILITGAFFSSASWFLLAKNYTYIHMHLCYVAWYLSYLPFAYMLILSTKKNENSIK